MSHGCSGDIWRRDYTKPAASAEEDHTIESYAEALLEIALEAYDTIAYNEDADLAMAEARLHLEVPRPRQAASGVGPADRRRMGDRLPKNTTEVYAREQIILHERQSTEIVVQALRIGDIGIATTPNETYALTGLKLKTAEPAAKDHGDRTGQRRRRLHPAARTASAGRLQHVARSIGRTGSPGRAEDRRGGARSCWKKWPADLAATSSRAAGPACAAILKAKPAAYWRLDEFAGPRAVDSSGQNRDAFYEPAVAFFLEGPRSDAFCRHGETNRAAHFAGGRLRSRDRRSGRQVLRLALVLERHARRRPRSHRLDVLTRPRPRPRPLGRPSWHRRRGE